MSGKKQRLGMIGMVLGSIGLLLALVHFWAGPFAPQPTLESVVAEKAASIRQATIDALKGKEVTQDKASADWDADRIAYLVTSVLGGLALILAVFSFTQKENIRVSVGAASLGLSAITFQFIAMYAVAFLVVMLIVAVLSELGF